MNLKTIFVMRWIQKGKEQAHIALSHQIQQQNDDSLRRGLDSHP